MVASSCGLFYSHHETPMPCPKCADFMISAEKPQVIKEEIMDQRKTKKYVNTGFEETLEAVKERRQGIRNAARQWSLLVWLLSDESRAISEDASDLTRQLILVARSNNYQEIAEMISFVKESAKEEDKRS